MNFFIRRPFDISQNLHTPENIYQNRQQHRRDFLKSLGTGIAAIGVSGIGVSIGLSGCSKPTDEEIFSAGKAPALPEADAALYPASHNDQFTYGRTETAKRAAAEYTNFYEFSKNKDSWQFVGDFQPTGWSFEVTGLCNKPRKFDMDDLYKLMTLEERAYRHRCVETWAMAVPWTGFSFSHLLKLVEPKKSARFVAFETFNQPEVSPGMRNHPEYPWAYKEYLTIDEALNDLTFMATGVFGEPLPKQHGAPVRMVVPWKYGFKSIKSIVKIHLTDKQPSTFWNSVAPHEYGTVANVNPNVPHPRFSQKNETMLGSGEQVKTQLYNGYGEYVAKLYG